MYIQNDSDEQRQELLGLRQAGAKAGNAAVLCPEQDIDALIRDLDAPVVTLSAETLAKDIQALRTRPHPLTLVVVRGKQDSRDFWYPLNFKREAILDQEDRATIWVIDNRNDGIVQDDCFDDFWSWLMPKYRINSPPPVFSPPGPLP